jgi:hypothetical protein
MLSLSLSLSRVLEGDPPTPEQSAAAGRRREPFAIPLDMIAGPVVDTSDQGILEIPTSPIRPPLPRPPHSSINAHEKRKPPPEDFLGAASLCA